MQKEEVLAIFSLVIILLFTFLILVKKTVDILNPIDNMIVLITALSLLIATFLVIFYLVKELWSKFSAYNF